jgi:hypothetical protein
VRFVVNGTTKHTETGIDLPFDDNATLDLTLFGSSLGPGEQAREWEAALYECDPYYGGTGQTDCCGEEFEAPATTYARYFVDGALASSDIELELVGDIGGDGWQYEAVGASPTGVYCTRGDPPFFGFPAPGAYLCCIPGEVDLDALIPLSIISCDPFVAIGSRVAASDGRLWEVEVFE